MLHHDYWQYTWQYVSLASPPYQNSHGDSVLKSMAPQNRCGHCIREFCLGQTKLVDEAQPCTLAPFTVVLLTTAFVLDPLGSWVFLLSQPHTALWLAKRERDGQFVGKSKNLLNWETGGSPRRQQGKFFTNSTENELANQTTKFHLT